MSPENNPRYTFKYDIKEIDYSISVDILIPFRDENAKVVDLLQSILEKVRKPRYKIYLIDDASKNKNFLSNFSNMPGFELVQFDKPVGFGAAINAGMKQCTSSTVCIMHSDTKVIEPNFLWNLCQDMIKIKDKNVASICSVTNNPMNNKYECLTRNASTEESLEFFTELNSPFICTLVNRQLFNIVGGFPEYPLCWYEQELFGDKLRKAQLRQAYSKSSYIYHEGGSTIKKLINDNKRNMDILKNNFSLYEQDKKKFVK